MTATPLEINNCKINLNQIIYKLDWLDLISESPLVSFTTLSKRKENIRKKKGDI